MAHEFKRRRRVEFAETDMAGILHFSNYFRFMEETEHEFFRSLGLRVHQQSDEGFQGWARAHAECTYRRPLRNDDVVELRLFVREKRSKSIKYEVLFFLEEGDPAVATEVARGTMTAVCVQKADGGLRAVAMPADVAAAVEVAPDTASC